MSLRKLVTISLPTPLVEEAERIAKEESSSTSEVLREALRLYVETRELRKEAARTRLVELIDASQDRAAETPPHGDPGDRPRRHFGRPEELMREFPCELRRTQGF